MTRKKRDGPPKKKKKEGRGEGEDGKKAEEKSTRTPVIKKENEKNDMGEDNNDKEEAPEEKHVEEVVTPRYQSSRAAAQVAKDKLSAKGVKAGINEEFAPASQSKPRTPKSSRSLPDQWVQCDKCSKWRSIPGDVDFVLFPEKWFCSMNKWDSARKNL